MTQTDLAVYRYALLARNLIYRWERHQENIIDSRFDWKAEDEALLQTTFEYFQSSVAPKPDFEYLSGQIKFFEQFKEYLQEQIIDRYQEVQANLPPPELVKLYEEHLQQERRLLEQRQNQHLKLAPARIKLIQDLARQFPQVDPQTIQFIADEALTISYEIYPESALPQIVAGLQQLARVTQTKVSASQLAATLSQEDLVAGLVEQHPRFKEALEYASQTLPRILETAASAETNRLSSYLVIANAAGLAPAILTPSSVELQSALVTRTEPSLTAPKISQVGDLWDNLLTHHQPQAEQLLTQLEQVHQHQQQITQEVAKRVELSGLNPESQQMATQIITQYILPPLLYASSFPQNAAEKEEVLSTAQRVFVDLGIERQGQKLDQAAANWVKTQPLFLTGTMPPLLVKEYYKAAYSPPDPVTQAAIEKIVTSPVSLEPITAEVAKNWQLGNAPPNTQPLREWAIKNKIGSALLIEAGILATSEERGDSYPRFRHRLMFPIRNDNGEVIAFSGRVLDADAKAAKYLNSPETLLFNKSKVLFGFDKSKRGINKSGQAIVCEGQIDTLMVYEAGFQNVVAGQGTAFTEFHAKALKRQADEVVLCYDSDNAGYKAAERAFQALAPFGLIVKVAMLPKGEDPDSYIRKNGVEAFGQLIKEAKDFVDYQLASVGSRRDLTEMRERIKFAEEMAENVKLFDTPMAKETTIQRVARSLGISEEIMRKLVTKAAKGTSNRAKKEAVNERPGEKLLASQDPTALLLCRIAIAEPEILLWLREHGDQNILHDLSGTDLLSRIWLDDYDPSNADAFNSFLLTLDRDEEAALTQVLHMPPAPGKLSDAQHALQILSITRLQQQKLRLQTQLKQPNLDPQEASDIQREIMDLHKELTEAQRSVAEASKA